MIGKPKLVKMKKVKKQEEMENKVKVELAELAEVLTKAELAELAKVLMKAKKQEELNMMERHKVDVMEEQKLDRLEKAKKQENYPQQPDEPEMQNNLASLFSMVSLELNMEGTIKTLKNAKAGYMDCIFFNIKNEAKKKKLEPSLHDEGQQEQEKNLHEL